MIIIIFFALLDYYSDVIDGNYVSCLPCWEKPDIDHSTCIFLGQHYIDQLKFPPTHLFHIFIFCFLMVCLNLLSVFH